MTLSASISKSQTGTKNPMFGKKHSEESKRKMSEAHKKRWQDPEAHKRQSEDRKRYFEDPETRKRNSEAVKAAMQKPEVRQKISEAAKKRYEDPKERQKTSEAVNKAMQDPEVRQRMSEAHLGKKIPAEIRKKISKSLTGTKNPMFGKKILDEHRTNLSKAQKKRYEDPEERKKISATHQGVTLEEWSGFVSFEPYCEKFNFKKKEQIREQYGRICFHCHKPESLNGQRLSVHHIFGDKMEGCDDKPFFLVPLCRSCNSQPMVERLVRERIESKIAKYRIVNNNIERMLN